MTYTSSLVRHSFALAVASFSVFQSPQLDRSISFDIATRATVQSLRYAGRPRPGPWLLSPCSLSPPGRCCGRHEPGFHFNLPRGNAWHAKLKLATVLLDGILGPNWPIGVLVQVVPARCSRGGPGRTNETKLLKRSAAMPDHKVKISISRERRPWWRSWNDYPNPTLDAVLALFVIAVIVMVFWFLLMK